MPKMIPNKCETKARVFPYTKLQVHSHRRAMQRHTTRTFWRLRLELVRVGVCGRQSEQVPIVCPAIMALAIILRIAGITLAVNLAVTLGHSRRVNVIWMVRDPEIIEFYLEQRLVASVELRVAGAAVSDTQMQRLVSSTSHRGVLKHHVHTHAASTTITGGRSSFTPATSRWS